MTAYERMVIALNRVLPKGYYAESSDVIDMYESGSIRIRGSFFGSKMVAEFHNDSAGIFLEMTKSNYSKHFQVIRSALIEVGLDVIVI